MAKREPAYIHFRLNPNLHILAHTSVAFHFPQNANMHIPAHRSFTVRFWQNVYLPIFAQRSFTVHFNFDKMRICISISIQRSLAVYFRLTRNEKKFRREVNIMMQFLFIEFFLRCDTKFVLSGMIFRLNSATIAMWGNNKVRDGEFYHR